MVNEKAGSHNISLQLTARVHTWFDRWAVADRSDGSAVSDSGRQLNSALYGPSGSHKEWTVAFLDVILYNVIRDKVLLRQGNRGRLRWNRILQRKDGGVLSCCGR